MVPRWIIVTDRHGLCKRYGFCRNVSLIRLHCISSTQSSFIDSAPMIGCSARHDNCLPASALVAMKDKILVVVFPSLEVCNSIIITSLCAITFSSCYFYFLSFLSYVWLNFIVRYFVWIEASSRCRKQREGCLDESPFGIVTLLFLR